MAFRLAHLNDPRARFVIERCAARFGWTGYRRRPAAGFAFARYKDQGAYCAIVLDVEVESAAVA